MRTQKNKPTLTHTRIPICLQFSFSHLHILAQGYFSGLCCDCDQADKTPPPPTLFCNLKTLSHQSLTKGQTDDATQGRVLLLLQHLTNTFYSPSVRAKTCVVLVMAKLDESLSALLQLLLNWFLVPHWLFFDSLSWNEGKALQISTCPKLKKKRHSVHSVAKVANVANKVHLNYRETQLELFKKWVIAVI